MLQHEEIAKGDWASTCVTDIKELNVSQSFEEIKGMSQYQFSKILKETTKENALKYFTGKQKSKGSEIRYSNIEMAEYLLTINTELTITQKQKLFFVRNRMI